MAYILGWLPFVINLFFIKSDPLAIFFIPISLLIGLLLIYIYDSSKIDKYKKSGNTNSKEYKKLKQDKDIAKAGLLGGLYYGAKSTKDCLKDISDVDRWKKFD